MFHWTAVAALLYYLLHTALMIVQLEAFRRHRLRRVAWAPLLHLAFSLLTLANGAQGGCVASLPSMAAVVVIAGVLCWRIVSAPDYAAKRQLRAWELLSSRPDATPRVITPVLQPVPLESSFPAGAGSVASPTAAPTSVRSRGYRDE
jgi:hypothetical protein